MDGLSRLFLDSGAKGGGATPAPGAARQQVTYLESPRLADVARTLHAVIDAQTVGRGQQAKVILVMDQPDLLLAAAGPGDGVTSTGLRELILELREVSPCLGAIRIYRFLAWMCIFFYERGQEADPLEPTENLCDSTDSGGGRASCFFANYDAGEGACGFRPVTCP